MKFNLAVGTIVFCTFILFISLVSGSFLKGVDIKCSSVSIDEDYELIDVDCDELEIKPFDLESGEIDQSNNESFEKGDNNLLFNSGIFETNPLDSIESVDIESMATPEKFDNESGDESTPLIGHENAVYLTPGRSLNHWLKPSRNNFIVAMVALTGMFSLSLFPEGRMVLVFFVLSHFLAWLCYFLINLTYS